MDHARAWVIAGLLIAAQGSLKAAPEPAPVSATSSSESLSAALNPQAWVRVEESIDRALAWMARQQHRNGSFAAPHNAQPATTSFVVMAFLSRGHVPGEGPYGSSLDRAIDFVVRSQQADGLLGSSNDSKTANYNHPVAGLMLTEVYGMTDSKRAAKLRPCILKALDFTRRDQTRPKESPVDVGGWRYLGGANDSDLSVSSWHLMFMRSAKNAEFDVPKDHMDDAVGFVMRCWDERQGLFYYKRSSGERRWSRGMVGAGILSLALAGQHDTPVAHRAGDWLLQRPFNEFGEQVGGGDRFFYSTYYCSQAMAQLGGRYWREFFPPLVSVLLRSQSASGAWPPEPYGSDDQFGNTYTTAMAVLSLTPPLQLLPVYQR